jgi:hypothetical protein
MQKTSKRFNTLDQWVPGIGVGLFYSKSSLHHMQFIFLLVHKILNLVVTSYFILFLLLAHNSCIGDTL